MITKRGAPRGRRIFLDSEEGAVLLGRGAGRRPLASARRKVKRLKLEPL